MASMILMRLKDSKILNIGGNILAVSFKNKNKTKCFSKNRDNLWGSDMCSWLQILNILSCWPHKCINFIPIPTPLLSKSKELWYLTRTSNCDVAIKCHKANGGRCTCSLPCPWNFLEENMLVRNDKWTKCSWKKLIKIKWKPNIFIFHYVPFTACISVCVQTTAEKVAFDGEREI